MTSGSHDEPTSLSLAAAALELLIGGSASVYDDGRASGAPDLVITWAQGSLYAEVTQDSAPGDVEAARLIARDPVLDLDPGVGDWLVFVKPGARISRVRSAVRADLATLPRVNGNIQQLRDIIAFRGADAPDRARLHSVPHDDGLPHFDDADLGRHLAAVIEELAGLPDNARKLAMGPSAFVVHVHRVKTTLAVQQVLHGVITPKLQLPVGCERVVILARNLLPSFTGYTPGGGWESRNVLANLFQREQEISNRWRAQEK